MFRKKNDNDICTYWYCNKGTQGIGFLCSEHYNSWGKGLLDKCPRCGRYKDRMYQFCLDCYVGRKIKKKKKSVADYSLPSNEQRIQQIRILSGSSSESSRYFVYILEVGNGVLYVGHTDDIRERLTEVRKAKKSPETGQPPILCYLERANSENSAITRENELKEIVISSPERIKSVSAEFYRNMKESGFDLNL